MMDWVSPIVGNTRPQTSKKYNGNPATALIHWIPTQLVKGTHQSLKWMVSQNAWFPSTAVTCVHQITSLSGKKHLYRWYTNAYQISRVSHSRCIQYLQIPPVKLEVPCFQTNPSLSDAWPPESPESPSGSLAFTTIERMQVARVESLIDPWTWQVESPKNDGLNASIYGNVDQAI